VLAVQAALVLAQVSPSQFPPRIHLEPHLRELPPAGQSFLLGLMEMPAYRRVATSPWCLSLLADWLGQPAGSDLDQRSRLQSLSSLLETLGRSASTLAPALQPHLAASDGETATMAARAFGSIAPGSPDLVAWSARQLTNERIAGPLLIWLTSLGTNAMAAGEQVSSLAQEVPDRPRLTLIDPRRARRGRLDLTGRTQLFSTRRDCPARLLGYWPGYARVEAETSGRIPDTNSGRYSQVLWHSLPVLSLRDLARNCLTNIQGSSDSSPSR
jgi:hypothetical protein